MGDAYERIMTLRQESNVEHYKEVFEALTTSLKDAYEEVLIGAFKNRLKLEIQADLHLFWAGSLTEIMGLAQCIGERNWLKGKGREDAAYKYNRIGTNTR